MIRKGVPKILHAYESLGTGRTSGWTSGVGLAEMVSAISGGSDKPLPSSVLLRGAYGYDGLSASVPVKLGPGGVREIVVLDLDSEEERSMAEALGYLKEVCASVEQMIAEK
jgi:malate dehydrogenase